MKILDACCGSRMFWYDKNNENTIYQDIRKEIFDIHRKHVDVNPDILADFKNMPYTDNEFDLVIFDPPHLKWAGPNSVMKAQYGQLDINNWQDDISKGFDECLRVLKPTGTLIFKWSDCQIHIKEVLANIKHKPILGDKRGKTRWLVFVKEVD
ncbi:class I SAM-dependent methyltransferase [Facklamia sp. P13069]|uniref:class I SAM-dependent methyltransferase n=1 Tax=Facklamia sp. P13069 TaxID=3421954 RepID=UPI003D1714CC